MNLPFKEMLLAVKSDLNPSELRVAVYISNNRHHALHASSQEIAEKSKTSDATVVRTAKSLGFTGLAALRRALASELEAGIPPANRIKWTVESISNSVGQAFEDTINLHQESLSQLKAIIPKDTYNDLVSHILSANKVVIFGIGPSAPMADYFAIQLRRFGISVTVLSHSGLLLADELLQIKKDDHIILLAYGHIYNEINVLLDHALLIGATTSLISDNLKNKLKSRVELIVEMPTGAVDGFLMHTMTLAFIETLLVGIACCSSEKVVENLKVLNDLRVSLTKNVNYKP